MYEKKENLFKPRNNYHNKGNKNNKNCKQQLKDRKEFCNSTSWTSFLFFIIIKIATFWTFDKTHIPVLRYNYFIFTSSYAFSIKRKNMSTQLIYQVRY